MAASSSVPEVPPQAVQPGLACLVCLTASLAAPPLPHPPTPLRRRCLFTMSNHTQAITQVKWGGDGLIYSAARDCSINVWSADDGRMVRRCGRVCVEALQGCRAVALNHGASRDGSAAPPPPTQPRRPPTPN